MKWSEGISGQNLFSSRNEWCATIYRSNKFSPAIRQITEYKWTEYESKENTERFNEEFGIDRNTPIEELKLKIETLYRLHGYE